MKEVKPQTLTLAQQFFMEKVKIEMESMTKDDLKNYILKLIELQYQKDKMWVNLLMDK